MIAFLEGRIEARAHQILVINVGGVGFAVQATTSALAAPGPEVRVYTRMIVREDAIELYGFLTQEEAGMFDKLTSVTGVGPKMALAILSGVTIPDLILAIAAGEEKVLTRVNGVGKKTAQRLLLELKDLAGGGFLPSGGDASHGAIAPLSADTPEREALEALMALGYSSAEAGGALMKLRQADGAEPSAAELIRKALQSLSRGG